MQKKDHFKTTALFSLLIKIRRVNVKMTRQKSSRQSESQSKTIEVDVSQKAVVDVIAGKAKPCIFELVDDCCYIIFDYLSRRDLCLFGQTCKWAQRVAANFYKKNYLANTIDLRYDLDVFALANTQKLKISANEIIRNALSKQYQQVETYCNESVKQIYLEQTILSIAKVNCLKRILCTIEHVTIVNCKIDGDLYEKFLKFCKKLVMLCLRDCHSKYEGVLIGIDNTWSTRKYPTLKSLELSNESSSHSNIQKLVELKTFFTKNPNVHGFGIDCQHLLKNSDFFDTADIKLDTLGIRYNLSNENYMLELTNYLNALHERNVFQRLHWYTKEAFTQTDSLNGLSKLILNNFGYNIPHDTITLRLVNITDLSIWFILDKTNLETIARSLVNLECVFICDPKIGGFLSFIRYSAKLRRFKVKYLYEKGYVYKLATWNNERKKLDKAKKVTIYVNEYDYLFTKRAKYNIVFSLIELKRYDSYDFDEDFCN